MPHLSPILWSFLPLIAISMMMVLISHLSNKSMPQFNIQSRNLLNHSNLMWSW